MFLNERESNCVIYSSQNRKIISMGDGQISHYCVKHEAVIRIATFYLIQQGVMRNLMSQNGPQAIYYMVLSPIRQWFATYYGRKNRVRFPRLIFLRKVHKLGHADYGKMNILPSGRRVLILQIRRLKSQRNRDLVRAWDME